MNALYQGNAPAKSAFDSIAQGATLAQKLASVYNSVIPVALQTAEGLASLSSQANFYSTRATELGISGDSGTALVAYASLIKIAVDNDYGGIGDGINDLRQAVLDGSAALPEGGNLLTSMETADGIGFDGDDASTGGTGTGTDTTGLPSGVTSAQTKPDIRNVHHYRKPHHSSRCERTNRECEHRVRRRQRQKRDRPRRFLWQLC